MIRSLELIEVDLLLLLIKWILLEHNYKRNHERSSNYLFSLESFDESSMLVAK